MKINKFNRVTRFLLWCAADDCGLIENCREPSIVTKRSCLGGLVLTPALFAFPAATYFFEKTLLVNQFVAICLGLIWALIIFNVDRYFVTGFHKCENHLKNFFSLPSLLRLLLSSIFSLVVSHTLVLKVYEPNLHQRLVSRHTEQINKLFDQEEATLEAQINALSERITIKISSTLTEPSDATSTVKRKKIDETQREIDKAQQEYADEIAGNIRSRSGVSGRGLTAIAIEKRIETLQERLILLEADLQRQESDKSPITDTVLKEEVDSLLMLKTVNIQSLNEKMAALRQLKDSKVNALKRLDETPIPDDFFTLSNALDDLSEENSNVKLWAWLLTSLLFTIDMMVVVLIALGHRDNYDLNKYAIIQQEKEELLLQELAYQNQKIELLRHQEKIVILIAKEKLISARCDHGIHTLDSLADFIEKHAGQITRLDKALENKDLSPEIAQDVFALTNLLFKSILDKVKGIVSFNSATATIGEP